MDGTRAKGYGKFKADDIHEPAHRVAYELFFGERIPPDLFACHHCDNPPCVNPYHIFPATAVENTQDAVQKGRHVHGERQHLSKLTEKQVLEIRVDRRTHREIADEYGIAQTLVGMIKRKLIWKHLRGPTINRHHKTGARGNRNGHAKLTDEQVREIRALKGKESGVSVATRYPIGSSMVYNIWCGISWQHVQ